MLLEPAINTHFSETDTVCVEEKMNGFNVRAIVFDGKITAITRGGYVCPYSTEKAGQLLNIDFFNDHPELVLHGEMVGPDNPYVPKKIYDDVDSIDFYVFDMRYKGSGEPFRYMKEGSWQRNTVSLRPGSSGNLQKKKLLKRYVPS